MKRVYIAGPYSSDPEKNTEDAIFTGDWVRAFGFKVYIPHLTHFWHLLIPHEYQFWMKHDLEWLELCDVFLRIPGPSAGADAEEEFASQHNIRVYHSMQEFIVGESK